MDQQWKTFGHKAQKLILERHLSSLALPHAYLFSGQEGVGKQSLALEFAKKLLKTDNLQNHPDFQIIDVQGEIIMDNIHDFISRLSLKPFVAKKKVAIINNAENLNPQSGNALLKTLEEPSADTVIILVSSGKLLPTIVSRCQISVSTDSARDNYAAFAKHQELKIFQDMAELSFGSSGRLKRFVEDADYFKRQRELAEDFKKIKSESLGEKLARVNNLAEDEPGDLRAKLLTWLQWQIHQLRLEPLEFGNARALSEAAYSLTLNKNKKLVLQTLMFKL